MWHIILIINMLIIILIIIILILLNRKIEFFTTKSINIEILLNKIVTIKSIPDYRIGDIFYNKGFKY